MKILITSGAGFIGSHLHEKHIREWHMALCLNNLWYKNYCFEENIKVE